VTRHTVQTYMGVKKLPPGGQALHQQICRQRQTEPRGKVERGGPDKAVFAVQVLIDREQECIEARTPGIMELAVLRIAVPDLISPSYLPAEAAVTLGFLANEGIRPELELIAPVEAAYAAMRDGHVDIVAGSAHSVLSAFPRWQGAKLLCAQSQGLYWFLVMRSDIGANRGDVGCVKGQRIGAAPWVGLALRQLLRDSGIDMQRDAVQLVTVSGSVGTKVNIGVVAAAALKERSIDGFWANGMGAEIAVLSGVGTLIVDARRGDGPKQAFNYTMATLATTDRLIRDRPADAAAAVRAIAAVHRALRDRVELAEEVAGALFPGEREHIVTLVNRDLPFYQSRLTAEFIDGMNRFARAQGILDRDVQYGDVVASQFRDLWT
jgi:ABC-type nitrate/sulfonate/bicarbonate transport system substrate-binding protein